MAIKIWGFGSKEQAPEKNLTDFPIARDFANDAYERTGGPTPDLQRVYGALLENERRREAEKSAS